MIIETEKQNNFLEVSVINELFQNIESIEVQCANKVGEDVVELRIKQLAYAKLLVNVYEKDISFLIKAYTLLGISYLDINYFEQAQEHLLNAFKLNESTTEDDLFQMAMKEYQVKILINLSKCYLENNKAQSALTICEKCLKMNQTMLGEEHISNADIYYVLAKINTRLKNYEAGIQFLTNMFNMYEKLYGFNSEKSAKICMELGQIYELAKNYNDAIEYTKYSYQIWEKVLSSNKENTSDDYEVVIDISMKLAELNEKVDMFSDAYKWLKETEAKYGEHLRNKKKKQLSFKKLLIKYAELNQDLNANYNELLDLEVTTYYLIVILYRDL